jgi:hypothetical protein
MKLFSPKIDYSSKNSPSHNSPQSQHQHENTETDGTEPFSQLNTPVTMHGSVDSRPTSMRFRNNHDELSSPLSTPSGNNSKDYLYNQYKFHEVPILQELSCSLLPSMITSNERKTCYRCHISFVPPFVMKNHCRCCGELYCGKCMTSEKVILPLKGDNQYDKVVKCCLYCFSHIKEGNYVSILRCLIILLNYDSSFEHKIKSFELLNFIFEHYFNNSSIQRILAMNGSGNSSSNTSSASSSVMIYQQDFLLSLGGYSNIWKIIENFLFNDIPINLRKQTLKFLAK